MSFVARLQRAREILEQQGRLSTRALERELGIGGDELDELIEELVDVQQVALREGRVLVWKAPSTIRPPPATGDAVARKVVTIVFADLIGSTALHERLDAESARALMDRYYETLRAAVGAHGGTVVKLLGDGVMAAFGVPRVAEDDAMRAVRAAVAMQHAFRALAGEENAGAGGLGLRVAVNTGEVVVSAANDDVVGDPVNVAARLQQEARDGDVVIGEATRRLVSERVTLAPVGVLALKGRTETVAAYRVVSLERPAGAAATAFVGRDDELRRLRAVYDAAVAAPGARLAVILGSPGLGKSRLLDEFARRLEGATVLAARCEAAGGSTFAPIAKAVRIFLRVDDAAGDDELRAAVEAAAAGDDADRSRIAAGIAALLAGTPGSPEETFFVVRRFLARLAAAQPVVLAIDDLQWAEPLLLDLIEHLVQWGTGVPLLLLVAARPELRDARSSLVSAGRLVTDVVTLGGLDAAAATRLAASVIGADALPAAIAGRVLATSEGNPLFVGELVRMLVDDGVLKREGDRWTTGVDLAALEIPPTIHALLAARIERLRAEDRLVLERAAIVGRQFSRAAVVHLLPREAEHDLDARLEALRRSELIEPDAGWFLGEPALRFHHGLARDAAYRRVLKGTRAELHARLADWIESRVAAAVEHDETIGWHLEQAHRHLAELGPIDAQGRALGERAASYLAAAGRRALGRDDLPLASSLLGRALERLDQADPARAHLALDWCEALLAAGDVGPGAKALDELGRFTAGSERLRAWHTCFAAELAVLTNPQTLQATADTVAAAAAELAAAGDGAGEAKAHSVHALALARLGKVGACEAALDKALAAARRAHDRRRSNTVLAGAPLAALWGPSPVTRASGRCLDVVRVLRITQGAPAVEAVALRCQAVLEALRGRAEAAQRMIASSRRMIEELGITPQLLETDVFAGLISLLEGDAAAAERSLRGAYEGLRSHGLGIGAARAAAFLGRALLDLGRAAEAEALSHESEALAGDDLQAAIAWRRVRAEALARRGEPTAAVDFARAAVEIAAATDALLHHAEARLALAAALRAAGRAEEADSEEKRAIELWEAKGATVLVERVRSGAGRVNEVERSPDDRGETVPRVRRRVPPNAATANAAHFEAAIAARDVDAIVTHVADSGKVMDHNTGAIYDREASLVTFRALVRAQDGTYRIEPLATLGDSLALFRQWTSASRIVSGKFDIGAYEIETVLLIEVDGQGRRRWTEIFAADRLGDAIVRLYERYAELLPEGPARARVAATARSVAAMVGPFDLDRWGAIFAPEIEFADPRVVGLGSVCGAEPLLRAVRALVDLTENFAIRTDDILALRSDALLVRWTNFGTDRAGGAFERRLCQLLVFGADGLLTRWEQLDGDSDAEALARFDELTTGPAAAPVRRRLRPNAATAHAGRLETAIAARDADALPGLLADQLEVVHHPTGVTYDRSGLLGSFRALFRAENATFRAEPLATLGDSLVLGHQSVSASGMAGRTFDVGAYEQNQMILLELDALGRLRRGEVFAADRLGDAIVRLYERYAELLPDGPEGARAAATARSVTVLHGSLNVERWATAIAPAVEHIDHRTLGLGSTRRAETFLRGLRSLLDVSDYTSTRIDDVLGLRSNAVLELRTNSGTARAGGGVFERRFIQLWIFGADGLLTRSEHFDVEREDEALARFDELTAEPVAVHPALRRLSPNVATATTARIRAAIAARDIDAVAAHLADRSEVVDHTTGTIYDRQGLLTSWRSLLGAQDGQHRIEFLATLGDSLALCREWISASGVTGRKVDVRPFEIEHIILAEDDERGRRRRTEIFAADRLGESIARLYERYANRLPDGPARARVAATARSVAAMVGPFDPERYATAFAPAVEVVDHRLLATFAGRGAETCLRNFRAWLDLADDLVLRDDDVLGLQAEALLLRRTFLGTARAGGGAFERAFIALWVFDSDGLLMRLEIFDADHGHEALARFDEIATEAATVRPVPRRVRLNAATANAARADAAIVARDAGAISSMLADESEVVDHTTGVAYDRGGLLGTWRALLKADNPTIVHEPLATLGDVLALCRISTSGSGFSGGKFDVGAYERAEVGLLEVDASGRRRRSEVFAPDHLADAIALLYERYAELLPDGPARARAAATAGTAAAFLGPYDLDSYATAFAPAIEYDDRRTLGLGSAQGAEAVLQVLGTMLELADGVANRIDGVLDLRGDALLVRWTNFGTDRVGGGAYERQFLWLGVLGTTGLLTRIELFDADRDAEALARFDELVTTSPAVRFENAATRWSDRLKNAWEAREWERVAAGFAPAFRTMDHRKMVRVELDRGGHLETLRFAFEMRSSGFTVQPFATRGDRLALARTCFEVSDRDAGPSEIEFLWVSEVDDHGDCIAIVIFDPDELDAAYAELDERYVAGEAAPCARTWKACLGIPRAIEARDWERLAAMFAPGFALEDHRSVGLFTSLSREEWVASVRALVESRPDARFRVHHALALDDRRFLTVQAWEGEKADGTFESGGACVFSYGVEGIRQWIVYDRDQLEAARTCYENLAAKAPSPRIENAATRWSDHLENAWEARDWERVAAGFAPGLRVMDRRKMVRIELDRGGHLDTLRFVFQMRSSRLTAQLLATRGDRLALARMRFEASDHDTGPSDVEFLRVSEVDDQGAAIAIVAFDPDDLDAAYAELDERYAAGEAAPYAAGWRESLRFWRAFAARDWEQLAAVFAPEFVLKDHRPLGLLTSLSRDEYVASVRALLALRPDATLRLTHVLAIEDRRSLLVGRWSGGESEGTFEIPVVNAVEFGPDGTRRWHFYDLDQLDEAWARFAALSQVA